MGVTIAIVALPTIGRDLGFADADVQWIVSAYALVFAGFLVVAGRAADLYGRRRLFMAGLGVFAAASLLAGLAWSPAALVVARGLQGLGAAIAVPAALSLLTATFTEPRERARALGLWTAAAAGGGASGYVVGGVITDAAGWEWVFLVNVPIALVALALVPAVLREARTPAGGRLDLAGAIAVTAGLGLTVYGFSAAEGDGFATPGVVVPLLAGVAALAAFVAIERRVADPVAPPGVIGVRAVALACVVATVLTATTSPAGVLGTLFLQEVLDFGPFRAALTLLPFSVAVVGGSLLGSALLPRAGARVSTTGGLAAISAAMAALVALPEQGGTALLVAGLAVAGLGLGVASVAATAVGVGAVEAADEGVASGLLNTAAQVGTAVGIALLLTAAEARSDAAGSAVAGIHLGYALAAGLAVAGTVAALALPRR